MKPIPVGILGATGMVGQRMVSLLSRHPFFEVVFLAASERSSGRSYAEATRWILSEEMPESTGRMPVHACDPDRVPVDVRIVLSALDSNVARSIEARFRDAGYAVVTNASPHRMDADVPLVIPEVNADHLRLLDPKKGQGFIVANPNCCVVPLAMALAPLHRRWPVVALTCATWQAISGAGYPGEAAWDIVGTVHPHAGNEEDKLAEEPQKILGLPGESADFRVSARCVRVPVLDGHLVGINVRLKGDPSPEDVTEALRSWQGDGPALLSCPRPPIRVLERRDRPSPRHDADAGGGMVVSVGRVERCPVMGIKLYALAHNSIRGAAGAAITNAELLLEMGYV